MSHNLWIWALQLLDDFKALVELGEDVDHRAGEEGVLRCLLELGRGKRRGNAFQMDARLGILPSYKPCSYTPLNTHVQHVVFYPPEMANI